jgi:hypothetical protein
MKRFDPLTVRPEDLVEGFQALIESPTSKGGFGFEEFKDGALFGSGVAQHAGQTATLGEVLVKMLELHDPSDEMHPAFIMGAVHAATTVLNENHGVSI